MKKTLQTVEKLNILIFEAHLGLWDQRISIS